MNLRELLAPPTPNQIEQSLARFSARAGQHYSRRLVALYLYGSRARGDYREDSDVDVAAILAGEALDYWAEVKALSDLSYEELVEHGVDLECRPLSEAAWDDPSRHENPSLVRAIRRDGRRLASDR